MTLLSLLLTFHTAHAAIDRSNDKIAEGRICEDCEARRVNQEGFNLASREQRRKMAELRDTSDPAKPEGGAESSH